MGHRSPCAAKQSGASPDALWRPTPEGPRSKAPTWPPAAFKDAQSTPRVAITREPRPELRLDVADERREDDRELEVRHSLADVVMPARGTTESIFSHSWSSSSAKRLTYSAQARSLGWYLAKEGYAFITNTIPLHALALILMGRYSSRLYVGYSSWYAIGTLAGCPPSAREDERARCEGAPRDSGVAARTGEKGGGGGGSRTEIDKKGTDGDAGPSTRIYPEKPSQPIEHLIQLMLTLKPPILESGVL
ncbi:hypothetical protein K523DRAFT_357236 [Schizophyllum commune Tattone D]|nr:hypothetical protein K523DRAFT_357236 [Schizophyllum commune Tattone D]